MTILRLRGAFRSDLRPGLVLPASPTTLWTLLLLLLVACALVACSSDHEPATPTSSPELAATQIPAPTAAATAAPTATATSVPKVFGPDTVFGGFGQQLSSSACFNGGDPRPCIRKTMEDSGASGLALRFFDEHEGWLVGLVQGEFVDIGRFNPWTGRDIGPVLVFVNSPDPEVFVVSRLINTLLEFSPEHPERVFGDDPAYELVKTAVETAGISMNSDEAALKYWGITYLESTTSQPDDTQVVLVQGTVHEFCVACALPVAERYAITFNRAGRPTGIDVLGMCKLPDPNAILDIPELPACPPRQPF